MINLLKNPFAVLGVTVQDSAGTIRQAALSAIRHGRLLESDAQAAHEALVDPATRLESEVSWLLGRSAPRVESILAALQTKPSTAGRLALLETIDGVARANLAAHLCAVERGGVSTVRALVEAQNEINPEAVFFLVNGNREIAGFPPVTETDLWEALATLQAQHCAAVGESIAAREEHRKFMVRLFADGWDPKGTAYTFLERVVAAYDAWYDAHLAAIGTRLNGHMATLQKDPSDTRATEGIKGCLALWDEYSTPLQHPTIDDKAVAARAAEIHGRVRALCLSLAREHWRFRAALQLAESLTYAFPDFPPVDLGLPERLDALVPMLARVPSGSAPHDLARTMASLQRDPAALAQSLKDDGFRRGDRSPAGKLYTAYTEAMSAAYATTAAEGVWIMLRCLAFDLHARHGYTAAAAGLLESLLAQEEDDMIPSEVRRLLERDAGRLRHFVNRHALEKLMGRGKFRAANRLLEELLLNPPEEAAHVELMRIRSEIQDALSRQTVPWWVWLLVAAGLASIMVLVVFLALR